MGPSPCDSCDGGGDTDLVRGVCVGSAVDVTFVCSAMWRRMMSGRFSSRRPARCGGAGAALVGVIPVV